MKVNGDKLQNCVIDGIESAQVGFLTSTYLVGKTKSGIQVQLVVTRDPDLIMDVGNDICITGI